MYSMAKGGYKSDFSSITITFWCAARMKQGMRKKNQQSVSRLGLCDCVPGNVIIIMFRFLFLCAWSKRNQSKWKHHMSKVCDKIFIMAVCPTAHKMGFWDIFGGRSQGMPNFLFCFVFYLNGKHFTHFICAIPLLQQNADEPFQLLSFLWMHMHFTCSFCIGNPVESEMCTHKKSPNQIWDSKWNMKCYDEWW